ncbi:hypothetical protein GUJ93_ZPchr0005g15203 [Zizania palustris]|uniref:C2 domain-containing protein n=1 Tax=Zizania palustris TaxID=103762 RepID=A0A8J5SMZ9_ZIZPA|nr:hypothetical protein GUJ93_ZPchr0005g15203 [Zizania palustris]
MMQRPFRPEEYSLKETSPHLGGAATGDKLTTTYDLVEQMQYLYVRVVKAKDLPSKDITGSCDPYVEVKLGIIKSSVVEITVKDKDLVKDDFIGRVLFDLNEVPKRVPPDSPLAPQWYRLEEGMGTR